MAGSVVRRQRSIAVLAAMITVLVPGLASPPAHAVPTPAAAVDAAPHVATASGSQPSSAGKPAGRLTGRVVSRTGVPIPDARVELLRAGDYRVLTADMTGPAGRYALRAPAGAYDVRLRASRFLEGRRHATVRAGRVVHRDFALSVVPDVELSGIVHDTSGHGWPLDAVVTVSGTVRGLHTAQEVRVTTATDPFTGAWSVTVPSQAKYNIRAVTVGAGYNVFNRSVYLYGPFAVEAGSTVSSDACGLALGYVSVNPDGISAPCREVPGGLVVGQITDGYDRAGLGRAVVTIGGHAVRARRAGLVPGRVDGIYSAFAPAGNQPWQANRPLYGPTASSVDVVADAVTRADLAIYSGRVEVTPAAVDEPAVAGGPPSTATLTLLSTRAAQGARVQLVESGADTSAAVPATSWQDLPPLPVATADNGAAELDGVLYSIGGRTGPGPQPTQAVYAWTLTNGWRRVADLPVALSDPTVGALDHRLVVTLGYDEELEPLSGTFVYDPIADSWSGGAAVAGEKADSGSAVLGDKVYVVAGCGESGCDGTAVSSVQVYNVADDSVAQVADYPGAEERPLCAGIDGRVWCTGGRSYEGDDPTGGSFVYDPATDRWAPFADPPVTLVDGAVSASGGRLVVTGGIQDGSLSDRTWAYEVGRGSWQELARSGQAVSDAAGACGHFRVGGTLPDGTPVATAQRLAGLTGCAAPDISWLSLATPAVTLRGSESREVTVTLDPSGLAPGIYHAAIRVIDDVPGGVRPIPVRFTVR